jgi:hypothetical protein
MTSAVVDLIDEKSDSFDDAEMYMARVKDKEFKLRARGKIAKWI